MVKISDVRSSNRNFRATKESGLVALFVGATSGIGLGTLKKFAEYANAPKIYIIGRSKKSASPLLEELTRLNPQATFIFMETEISLIKNVDIASEEIKSKEKKLDVLFLSPGYLTFDGRDESSEGIDIPHALRYYSRLRFVYNLLPLLTASSTPRVIAILAAGRESAIDINDLEVRNNFTTFKAASNGTTQTTLAFEELAKSHPTITFIHKYPGFVGTGALERLMGTAKGLYSLPATFVRWVLVPIANLFAITVDEAGERCLFLATSAMYPPAEPKTQSVGVALPLGLEIAKSSVYKDGKGNGVYRLGAYDDVADEGDVLPRYRQDGVDKLVWEQTQAVWDRALNRAA